jgi:hypothetical protein
MKNLKTAITILLLSIFAVSCSKDDSTPVTEKTPDYIPFGYFQGNIEFAPFTVDDKFPAIFVLENDNKLLVGFNSVTLNQTTNLLKGSYTVTGNQISGSYINANIIPPTTYRFIATYDSKTAKFSGTLGLNTNTSGLGTIAFEKRI